MRKLYCLIVISLSFLLCFMRSENVSAKGLVNSKTTTDIFGTTIGTIQIYNDGEIVIGYRYGLRKVNLYYCAVGDGCNNNFYSSINVMDSSLAKPYKNVSTELAVFSYKPENFSRSEYNYRVEVYFGQNRNYTGTESLTGSTTIYAPQYLEAKSIYIDGEGTSDDYDVDNKEVGSLMNNITKIVNKVVLPILYAITSVILIVKGALLGTQIVKSADLPDVRMEKIRALKWLVIGVGISYAAATVVGALTGFFKDVFK